MHSYVNHAHVAWSFVGVALGLVGFVLGLLRKLVLLAVLGLAVLGVALYFGVVSLHGTHCTPGSEKQVCITVR
ncbi:MAG TPA: hypothetical protein VIJ71_08135 [Mycobacteriales bacterium]